MEVRVNRPEPVPVTYDLIGLTEDEVHALYALTSRCLMGSLTQEVYVKLDRLLHYPKLHTNITTFVEFTTH